MVPLSYRLSLYIREFFGDLPITNTEDVDTTYMSTRPRVTPKLHDAVISAENLLGFERGAVVIKDRLPGTPNCISANVPNPVRGGSGGVEYAIVGDKRQGCLEIVFGPSCPEALYYRAGVHLDVQGLYLA